VSGLEYPHRGKTKPITPSIFYIFLSLSLSLVGGGGGGGRDPTSIVSLVASKEDEKFVVYLVLVG